MAILPLTIVLLLMLIGLAGSVLPGLPGAPLVWLATVLYGYIEGWIRIRWPFLLLGGLAVAVAGVLDYAAHQKAFPSWTASRAGRWGALVGGLLGLFTLGPLGLVIGPFTGALLVELLIQRRWRRALQACAVALLTPLGARRAALLISLLLVLGFVVKVLGGAS